MLTVMLKCICVTFISCFSVAKAACPNDKTPVVDLCGSSNFYGYGLYLDSELMRDGHDECNCVVSSPFQQRILYTFRNDTEKVRCDLYTFSIFTSHDGSTTTWDCSIPYGFSAANGYIFRTLSWDVSVVRTPHGVNSVEDPGFCLLLIGTGPLTITCDGSIKSPRIESTTTPITLGTMTTHSSLATPANSLPQSTTVTLGTLSQPTSHFTSAVELATSAATTSSALLDQTTTADTLTDASSTTAKTIKPVTKTIPSSATAESTMTTSAHEGTSSSPLVTYSGNTIMESTTASGDIASSVDTISPSLAGQMSSTTSDIPPREGTVTSSPQMVDSTISTSYQTRTTSSYRDEVVLGTFEMDGSAYVERVGMISGGTIAAFAFCCTVAALLIFCRRRREKTESRSLYQETSDVTSAISSQWPHRLPGDDYIYFMDTSAASDSGYTAYWG